jgi:hypothetical protein
MLSPATSSQRGWSQRRDTEDGSKLTGDSGTSGSSGIGASCGKDAGGDIWAEAAEAISRRSTITSASRPIAEALERD